MPKIMQICAVDITMSILLETLNKGTIQAGYVTIGVCSKGKDTSRHIEGLYIERVQINRSIGISNLKSIYSLVKVIRKHKPDIVHVHTPIAAVLGRIAAKICRVPFIIYTAHGFYFHENMKPLAYKIVFSIEKLMARLCTDYILTQSSEDAQLAVEHRFLPEDKIICISNGVDVNVKFNPDTVDIEKIEMLKKELNLKGNELIVSFIGRLVEEKGILDLLKAFSLIKDNNIKLLVIGGYPQDERDQETYSKLKEYETNPNLIFLGQRNDIRDLLYLSDIFCLPSYREGMPRSIIEAMAMRNAIIATDIRGSREEVVDGETGYLVPIKSPSAIKDKIIDLMNDRDRLEAFKNASRDRSERLYNEDTVVQKQVALFDRLLNRKVGSSV